MARRTLLLFLLLLSMRNIVAQEVQTVHVFVALCDNKYQGIVKVPAAIGNGQKPDANLYWGCAYGVRTFFKKSADWAEVQRTSSDSVRLERVVFRHRTKNWYLVADAYDGRYIRQCTEDFLGACAGRNKGSININGEDVAVAGGARVIAYVGHDGLMDFTLADVYRGVGGDKRDAIILACASRPYFTGYIRSSGANPLLWTTNLMAPEAYVLHDALATYIGGGTDGAVRESAAAAYDKYQKCGMGAARKLLVTGF